MYSGGLYPTKARLQRLFCYRGTKRTPRNDPSSMAGVRFDGFASCGPGRAKVKAAVTLRAACVSGKRETDDD
jgi:hypothetical protein